MKKDKLHIPFFQRGDIGGVAYLVTNNIVNYLIVIATLTGVMGWPNEIVFGRVVPGMSIGLLLGCLYYAWMGVKLARKEGRTDVTALPSGVSTPAMFVILYGVIMPLHYALEDPYLSYSAALAACFIGGFVEFLDGFIGPWMKRHIPRAALLGTVAGIGFIWMATQGLFDVFGDPLVGLPILFVAMLGLFGGYLFPKKIPPLIVALVGGVVYAPCLGRTHFDFSGVGFYFSNPISNLQYMINGFAVVAPYLTIIIPVEIYNFVETMDNVEAANAAGDNYNVRVAQFADGICTMLSAVFGGVIPNTVWLGHAGLKKSEARIGYSVISGIVLGLAGIFGLFTFLNTLVPPAVCAITFLWSAVVMLSQAFKDCSTKHYAAIGIAMIPSVADYMYSQITGAIGLSGVYTEVMSSGLSEYTVEFTQMLKDAGVMWNGVPAVKSGAILIGILLGTMTVAIIDRKLNHVAVTAAVGYVLACFGFIHSAQLGFTPFSPFAIAYLIVAVLALVFHLSRKKLLEEQEDFEYV